MHIPLASHAARAAACVLAVAVVSALVWALDQVAPILSLGTLYLFAVVPIAVLWGLAYAAATSLLGVLVFNFFFLPPLYTLSLADTQNWIALAIYLVTAIVVSDLAARVRRRAADAEQREREEGLLADVATTFLGGTAVADGLADVAARVAPLVGAEAARIELGPPGDPPRGESPYELRAAGDRVGTLYLIEGGEPNLAARKRLLPALASLLAVAVERERLIREGVEAEALRRSDAIKTAVLRAVSHDLQSPLTAVLAAAETLRSPHLSLAEEDRAALLETIALEAHRLERLVRDLLDLSRLQAGAAEPNLELWTADELVAQALDDVGPLADRVRVDLAADLPPVLVDATQVRRALANLLENALKFSPAGTGVVVRANTTRKDLILRIVDRGAGIAEDELERVFEPFYRAPGASERGSGLGLAISRGFVEASGGRIWAESRPEQGSTFAVAFEAVRSAVPQPR